MKTNEKEQKADATKLEDWMPIKSPCSECSNVVFSKPPALRVGPPGPKLKGCKMSMDGFGNMPALGTFRDPHVECSMFKSSMYAVNENNN